MEVLLPLYSSHFIRIYGGMRRECCTIYNTSAKKISEKQELCQSIVTNWIRTKIIFCVIEVGTTMFRWIKEQ